MKPEQISSLSVDFRTHLFVVVNTIGSVLYLFAASSGWVEPEVADIPGAAGGGALVWFLVAVPVFLVFFLGNIGVFVWSCVHRYRRGAWFLSRWGLLVPLIWLLAVVLDFSRHGT
jgi:hypothetical protein